MTDTIISDSGVKYDIWDVVTVYYPWLKWKHTWAIKSIKEWNDGSITYDIDWLNIQVEYDYIQKLSTDRYTNWNK